MEEEPEAIVVGAVRTDEDTTSKTITKKETFGDVELETVYRESTRPSAEAEGGGSYCPPFNPRTIVPEPGIICEQDVAVKMRDGVTIYVDIYRPEGQKDLPVIISWSPFGKRPGDAVSEWQLMGVPPGTVSRMTKFESADPGFWCHRGYAIANVDPRGVGHSEGDVNLFGTQDGRDGYDFIEWVATQWWCNGKIGMFGNSGVAMTQHRVAQSSPLTSPVSPRGRERGTCIVSRSTSEGFRPRASQRVFSVWLRATSIPTTCPRMAKKYPLINEYWEDKRVKWEKIRVPAYITAGWCHPFHLRASIECFRKIRSTKKWLRTHREFEWADSYNPDNLEDLKRFFDRYLKDIRNGWELTPRVRLEVMDAYEYDFQTDRPEKEFPLARTQYAKLYLDASKGKLSFDPIAAASKVSYDGVNGETYFDITFDKDTEITGYMKLRLWVEADGHDDMDLFMSVRKLDAGGNYIPVTTFPGGGFWPGAVGQLRASHRELDPDLSTEFQPVQAHTKEEKLKPGEIVPVDIEMWPHSRMFHKGEQLHLVVAGQWQTRNPDFPIPFPIDANNKGTHIIHAGGNLTHTCRYRSFPPGTRREITCTGKSGYGRCRKDRATEMVLGKVYGLRRSDNLISWLNP